MERGVHSMQGTPSSRTGFILPSGTPPFAQTAMTSTQPPYRTNGPAPANPLRPVPLAAFLHPPQRRRQAPRHVAAGAVVGQACVPPPSILFGKRAIELAECRLRRAKDHVFPPTIRRFDDVQRQRPVAAVSPLQADAQVLPQCLLAPKAPRRVHVDVERRGPNPTDPRYLLETPQRPVLTGQNCQTSLQLRGLKLCQIVAFPQQPQVGLEQRVSRQPAKAVSESGGRLIYAPDATSSRAHDVHAVRRSCMVIAPVLLVAAAIAAQAAPAPSRPHIVFLLADDLGWGTSAFTPARSRPPASTGWQPLACGSSSSMCSPSARRPAPR